MNEVNIRRYKSGDEEKIITLFHAVHRKTMGKSESILHWNWKYLKNPYNRLEILMAFHNNKLIGHYAVIPVKMKIKKEEVLASLALDVMTHDNYRGRNIFPKLGNTLHDQLAKSEIPITYGFPNAFSIDIIINKINWFEISDLPIYFRPLNCQNMIKGYFKSNLLSKYLGFLLDRFYSTTLNTDNIKNLIKIKKIRQFNQEFDELWDNIKNEIGIGVIRNSDYLNWRYSQKPEGDYEIYELRYKGLLKGYIILKIEERFNFKIGLIMDILTESLKDIYHDMLINFSLDYFKQNEVDLVSCIMFSNCKYFKSLRRYKFLKIPKTFFPEEIHFGARRNNLMIDIRFIKNPKNWYLTWGDTDVV